MDTSRNTRVRLISDADSAYTLTVIKTEGKRGINVRASYKSKDAAKAEAGCRSVHQSHEEADKAVRALVETATTQRGWKVQVTEPKRSMVGAFAELPAAPVKAKK